MLSDADKMDVCMQGVIEDDKCGSFSQQHGVRSGNLCWFVSILLISQIATYRPSKDSLKAVYILQ